MSAPLCECGGRRAHHTGDEGCWCRVCLSKPEEARCRAMVPVPDPHPSVDRNTAPVGHEHPDTAHRAAAGVLPRTGTQRREVYDLIRKANAGLTDDELEQISGRSHQSISATRNSLMVDGLIYDSREQRLTRYGNDAIVWRARPV